MPSSPRPPSPFYRAGWKPPLGWRLDPAHPLARGLVAAWEMQEGGGTRVRDLIGSNHGTLESGLTWQGGRTGLAVKFNNSNKASVTDPVALRLAAAVTVESLVYYDSAGAGQGIFDKTSGGSTNQCYQLFLESGTGKFRVNRASSPFGYETATTAALTAGRWHHLVGTYDGATIRTYLNGVADGTAAMVNTINAVSGDALIGSLGSGFYPFIDRIEYVRVWDRALSAGEVRDLSADPYQLLIPPAPHRQYWWVHTPISAATLRPNAAGANDTWTPNGAATNWESVDETSSDGDTTYASNNDTTSPHEKLTVALGAMPEAVSSVHSVIFHYIARSASGTPSFVPVVRINGVDIEGSAHNLSNSYTQYTWDITGQATWTEVLLNGLEVGGRRNTLASNLFRITQMWVDVTYAPGPPALTRTAAATVAVAEYVLPPDDYSPPDEATFEVGVGETWLLSVSQLGDFPVAGQLHVQERAHDAADWETIRTFGINDADYTGSAEPIYVAPITHNAKPKKRLIVLTNGFMTISATLLLMQNGEEW